MSEWLGRKDLCQRCFSGIDDDHDGKCYICEKMEDNDAAWMRRTRLAMEIFPVGFYIPDEAKKFLWPLNMPGVSEDQCMNHNCIVVNAFDKGREYERLQNEISRLR